MQALIGCVVSYDEIRLFLEKPTEVIEAVGASLIYLPHSRNRYTIKTYCEIMDGLLLTGGVEDIAPKWYGAKPHPKLSQVDETRDYLEIALLGGAFKTDLPVLGICRGMQIINVAAGGTLYQDLPSQRKGTFVDHLGDWDGYERGVCGLNTHCVQIASNSILGTLIPEKRLEINSYHHQAIKELADGFRTSAIAEDGVIEAVESEAHSFILGVQWHIELQWDRYRAIFREFVARAEERKRKQNAAWVVQTE